MVSFLVALGALSILTFMGTKLVNGQSTQVLKTVIANSDPQMTYSPQFCSGNDDYCLGAWWDTTIENGTIIKITAGPSSGYQNAQTTLSYSFYGSSVEVYGLGDIQGANMLIQIDNFLAIVNTSSGIGGASQLPVLIHNHTQLDTDSVHTLSIGWSGNSNFDPDSGGFYPLSYVYFDHLVIGDFRAVDSVSTATTSNTGSISSASSSAAAATSSSIRATSTKIKPGALVGIVISILVVVFLCTVSICFFPPFRTRLFRRGHRLRRVSPGVKVTIESLETYDGGREPSPAEIENWKARPHLSLPPVYGYSGYGSSEDVKVEKGDSYLDLESRSIAGSSTSWVDSSDEEKKQKRKLSSLLVPHSATALRVSHPPRAKLRVNTRKSVLYPREHTHPLSDRPTIEVREDPGSPPITPYCVGIATVARPQNAQLVPNSSLSNFSPNHPSAAPPPPVPPLPPLPPLPPVQTNISASDEKRRLAKHLSSFRRSRNKSRFSARAGDDVSANANTNAAAAAAAAAQAQKARDQNALDVEPDPTRSSSRPSFDAMSVMTRSVPPPYTLHG